MILKPPDGHVDASRALDVDQIVGVSRHFFFMRDVAKFQQLIFDRTDTT